MSQGPLCPNLSQKVQKEVSQMANHNLSCADAIRWFKCKLKPPKNGVLENIFLHLYTGFELKIQNTNGRKSSLNFFDIHKIGT